jgi:hypothetical protein
MDTIETELQHKLEEFYVDMYKYTFAGMRRFLPVTRNPMNCKFKSKSQILTKQSEKETGNLNAHKVATQLNN